MSSAGLKSIRRLFALTAITLPLLLLAFSPLNYRFVDDAYISFRYARNLAHGLGLVFNQGEYVEGITNLLWTLTLTIPELLGIPVDIAAFWLGIAFAFLALRESARLAAALGSTDRARTIAVLMLALYPSFWRAAGYGLEAGLLAFLVTRTVCLAITSRPIAAGVTAGLVFLTRPDTLMVGPVVAIYEISRFRSAEFSEGFVDRCKRRIMACVAPWAAIVSIVTVWRLVYYDAWLPNTLAAKSLPLSFTVETLRLVYRNSREGVAYWIGFLYSALPLAIASLLAAAVNLRNPAVWLCIGVLGVQLPAVLINAGDWMAHYRLLAPYAPLLASLSAIGIDKLFEWLSAERKGNVGWLPAAIVGMVILPVAVMLGNHQWIGRPQLFSARPTPCFENLARLLRPVLVHGDRVSPEVLGIFSYRLPDVYVHDFMGLTDRRVATEGTRYLKHYGTAYPKYTYDVVRPTVILVQSGFGHLTPMAQAAAGRFNETYSTYSLDQVPGCFAGVLMSVRTEEATRILSAFPRGQLKQVLVPSTRAPEPSRSTQSVVRK
jgi:arabinofuranosyltransferase